MSILPLLTLLFTCPPLPTPQDPVPEPTVAAWWVDSLTQVLVDAQMGTGTVEARVDVARGEVEAIQLAVRSSARLRASLCADALEGGLAVRVRAVGRVPIKYGTHHTPVMERIAEPPALLPDPLFERTWQDLTPDVTESFWLDLTVSGDVEPGKYRTTVRLTGEGLLREFPLDVRVHEARVPFQGRLRLTNWFRIDPEVMGFGATPVGSEDWWACAEACFDSMWAHRQDTFWTPLREPWISARGTPAGELVFDFSFFDRWVETFSRARGGERQTWIEGQPIAARKGYDGKVRARVWRVIDGEVRVVELAPDDPAAEAGYRAFLGALRSHLVKRGWTDRFRLHVTDEPHGDQLEDYATIAGYVRKYAPELRIMEALDVKGDYAFFEQHCDVWVPQLGRFGDAFPRLLERISQGEEVWFYTCLFPNGRYPNRFVDYPLIKTRVLKWIAFQWGFSGFLHWGWNHWRGGDPFTVLEPPHGSSRLPPGDAWVVYPGERGVLDSMRHEAMRDGVEDFELLGLLAVRDPDRAHALAGRLVRSFTDYARDPAALRSIRVELLDALSTEQESR